MVSRESLREQFEALGTVPADEILDKCVEICITYGLHDPEEFVEQWMAFSVSNLGGAEPTVEYLRQMERKEFNKKDHTIKKAKETSQNHYLLPADTSLKNDISCSSYVDDLNVSNPYTKEEKVYKTGAVVCTFGKLNIAKNATWVNDNNKSNIEVQVIPNKNGEYLDSNAMYMFDNLMDKCAAIGDNMYIIGQQLCDKYLLGEYKENILDSSISQTDISNVSLTSQDIKKSDDLPANEYSDLSYVNVSGQDIKKCIGRVFCDADGRLNSASVMVHSTDDQAVRTCRLNFNNMQSYDIYPGQVCMIKGTNPRGNVMFLKDIKTELPLPKPAAPKMIVLDGPLHMVVASGPFTLPNNLLYQPFKDLTSYVKQHQPHVVILLGPFIDVQHKQVIDGELSVAFAHLVETLLLDILEAVGSNTKIIVVASSRDAVSAEVYPTPPYKLFNKITRPNLLLLPDPCTVNIQGVTVTLTSTDILKHMQDEELTQNVGRDVVKRCVRRIFHTRNMYPISPPAYDVSLDTQLWSRFCEINSMPHMLVLPSENRFYTRDIDGCVALNPGRVVDGINSGTFSRIEIHPYTGEGHWFEKLACQTIKM